MAMALRALASKHPIPSSFSLSLLFSTRSLATRPLPLSFPLLRLRPLLALSDKVEVSTIRSSGSLRCFSTSRTASSLNDPSPNWSNRPPKETILLDGCDFEHWLVVVEPPDPNLTRDDIIKSYIKTLAQVVGSEEEARFKIYSVSTKHYFAFGALVSEELSYKIKELPGVRWVLPDSYLDVKNKDYGGEPFINGEAVPYDPKYHEEWVRNNARANERNRRNDRPRNSDRSRNFERRRENMQNFQNRPPMPPMPSQEVGVPGGQPPMPPRDISGQPPMPPRDIHGQPPMPPRDIPGQPPMPPRDIHGQPPMPNTMPPRDGPNMGGPNRDFGGYQNQIPSYQSNMPNRDGGGVTSGGSYPPGSSGYQGPPNAYQGGPGGYQAPPNPYQRGPGGYQGPPNAYQGGAGGYPGTQNAPHGGPAGYQGAPNTPQGGPVSYQGPPNSPQGGPLSYQGPPNAPQGGPVSYQGGPGAYQGAGSSYQGGGIPNSGGNAYQGGGGPYQPRDMPGRDQ